MEDIKTKEKLWRLMRAHSGMKNCLPASMVKPEGSCEECPYDAKCSAEYVPITMQKDLVEDVFAALSDAVEQQKTRLITLEELQTGHGHGWEECWMEPEDGEAGGAELTECVWINGHVMLEDGTGSAGNYAEHYGYRLRIWAGEEAPTDEARRRETWQHEDTGN